MPTAPIARIVDRLRAFARPHDWSGRSDAELVGAFVEKRDEDAFAEIVRRHGPMVLAACRRVLANRADADDAFQAAFLVLVRKAPSVRPRSMLVGWLYGVARRAALKAARDAGRRANRERERAAMRGSSESVQGDDEALALLDEAIDALPPEYRAPILLCELEGKTRACAARELGWPEGTVASRLARGRALLARRLTGLGLSLAAVFARASRSDAAASLPSEFVVATTRAALGAAGKMAAGASARAVALSTGVMKSMLLAKLKLGSAALAAVVALSLLIGRWGEGAGTVAAAPATKETEPAKPSAAKRAGQLVSLELVRDKDVRADIGCTEEQSQKIAKIMKDAMDEFQAKLKRAIQAPPLPPGGAPGAPGVPGRPAVAAGVVALSLPQLDHKEASRTIARDVLTPAQVKRLRQLDLQAQGPAALLTRHTIRALRLSEEQEDQIDDMIEAFREQNHGNVPGTVARAFGGGPIFGGGGGPGAQVARRPDDDSFKKSAEAQRKATQDALKVLTKDQRQTWDELVGKEFPLERLLRLKAEGPFENHGFGGMIQLAVPALPAVPPAPPAPPVAPKVEKP